MLADEVVIYPNIRPENSKFFGIDIPGTKVWYELNRSRLQLSSFGNVWIILFAKLVFQVYRVQRRKHADELSGKNKKQKYLYLTENTVKATKELIAAKQQQSHDLGAKMTLTEVGNNIVELKREQANLRSKLNGVEENIKTILDIMVSRNPAVQRIW